MRGPTYHGGPMGSRETSTPARLVMYTRTGCPLCEEMEQDVRGALPRASYVLEKVDVDGDRALEDRFGLVVPVLAIGEEVLFETRVDRAALPRRVAAALGRT